MDSAYFVLYIYNTLTGAAEEVEVSKEIFDAYRRLGYNAEYRERKARKNETVFSDLRGGSDYSFDNFHEFRADDEDPQRIMADSETIEELGNALGRLAPEEAELLRAFFTGGKSERRCAAEFGIPYMTFRHRKEKALKKLRKILTEK